MNTTDALALIDRISATWPAKRWDTARIEVWTEVLTDMNTNQATETYRLLRNESDTEPTIAAFRARYRTLAVSTPLADCDRCEHGWLGVVEHRNGHAYQCAAPCTCPAGQANKPTHRTIVSHNVAELDRLSLRNPT